jgi:hypothetical protein
MTHRMTKLNRKLRACGLDFIRIAIGMALDDSEMPVLVQVPCEMFDAVKRKGVKGGTDSVDGIGLSPSYMRLPYILVHCQSTRTLAVSLGPSMKGL